MKIRVKQSKIKSKLTYFTQRLFETFEYCLDKQFFNLINLPTL